MTPVKKPKIAFPKKGKTTTVDAVEHPLPEVHIYKITGQGLDKLEESSSDKSFFSIGVGISFTIFISFLITVCTVEISNIWLNAIFMLLIPIGLISFIIFSYFTIKSICKSKKMFEKVRKGEAP